MESPLPLDKLDPQEIDEVIELVSRVAGWSPNEQYQSIEEVVLGSSDRKRHALLIELLNPLLSKLKAKGKLEPLHVLKRRWPKLAKLLTGVYPELDSAVRLPDQIGRYRILKYIGEGAQGTTVVGVDAFTEVHREHAATKYIIKYSTEKEASERLEHEAEILKMFEPPGSRKKSLLRKRVERIRSYIDHGVDTSAKPRVYYLVLEYLEGQNLQGRFGGFPVSTHEAVRIILDIADAAAAMHERDILHRDIKPSNAVVSSDGRAKLIDAGLAINMQRGGEAPLPIQEFWGTVHYMPPEQLFRQQISTPTASDVYSLGATFYFLLTGKSPASHVTEDQSKLLQSGEDLTNVKPRANIHSEIHNLQHVPYQLREICWKAMRSDFAERYMDAKKFADAVRAYQYGVWRSRLQKSIPLVAAAVIALVLWISALTSDKPGDRLSLAPLPANDAVQSFLRDNNLTRDSFSLDNFEVSVERAKLFEHSDTASRPMLCVRYIDIPDDLLGSVEFRVGKRMWGGINSQLPDGRYYAPLSESMLASDDPIEIRMDSMPGHETGVIIGSWNTGVIPSQVAFDDQEDRKLKFQSFAESDWLRMTPSGWIINTFSGFDMKLIQEVKVGHQPNKLSVVATRSGQLFKVSSGSVLNPTVATSHIENYLSRHLKDTPPQKRSTVFIQLLSIDGVETDVRMFTAYNPHFHKQTRKELNPSQPQPNSGGGASFPFGASRASTENDDAASSKYRNLAPRGGQDP